MLTGGFPGFSLAGVGLAHALKAEACNFHSSMNYWPVIHFIPCHLSSAIKALFTPKTWWISSWCCCLIPSLFTTDEILNGSPCATLELRLQTTNYLALFLGPEPLLAQPWSTGARCVVWWEQTLTLLFECSGGEASLVWRSRERKETHWLLLLNEALWGS